MAVDGVRPRLDGVARDDAPPQLGAGLSAHGGRGRGERDAAARRGLGIARRERELQRKPAEELVERYVARQHRHPAGGGLVDDLVERLAPSRLRRAQERIRPGEQRRELVARQRPLDPHPLAQDGASATVRSSSRTCARSSSVSAGPRISSSASQPRRLASSSAASIVCTPSSASSGRGRARRSGPARRSRQRRENWSTSIAWPIAWTFGLSSGNEPRLTLSTTSASASREPQRAVGVPVRVPERERNPQRLAERRRQQREERDHVRSARRRDASRRGSTEAASAALERDPTRDARRRAERAERHVRGQIVPADVVAEDVTALAAARPARSIMSIVCASAGWSASTTWVTKTSRTTSAGGAAIVSSTSVAHLPRELLRSRVPVGVARVRRCAQSARELAVGEHADERLDERVGSARGHEEALDAVVDEVEDATGGGRDDARPRANDSMITRRDPRATTAARARSSRRASRRRAPGSELRVVLDLVRGSPPAARRRRTAGDALADDHEPRLRQLRRHATPGRAEAVDVLVRLEHADEERHGGRSGNGVDGRSVNAERSL